MERRRIEVYGVVQGVGFRPFIKLLADRYCVTGLVQNMGAFVRIEAQAECDNLDRFILAISMEAPPLARIQQVSVSPLRIEMNEMGFKILPSSEMVEGILQMPSDAGICKDCMSELTDKNNRRYLHPFIACTNCGPRYSMIECAPYDRERTSMKDFPLCTQCQEEYSEPGNRRYHAQPVCCNECGPRLYMIDKKGIKIDTPVPITSAREILQNGGIIAAKGLGGYHLICDALDSQAIIRLRTKKKREAKPLAVMVPDMAAAQKWCHINDAERLLLLSAERPIVLLRKRNDSCIPDELVFNNPYIGLMLPSTGMQRLLFDYPDEFKNFELLVMTSGNISEEPICISETEAIEKLGTIAECILAHDRRIITRADDSVSRVFNGRTQVIRRARGYAPLPVSLPFDTNGNEDVFAAGGQTKNTWCLLHNKLAFVGPHIGDLDDIEALLSYSTSIERFSGQTGIIASIAAHDLHPDYLSTQYAHRFQKRIPVQHHHAHMAATMAENRIIGEAIGIIFDGLGLGEDESMWGGEFLAGSYAKVERIGHINAITMAGGDRAAKEPRLSASFWLRAASVFGAAPLELARRMEEKNTKTIDNLLNSRTLTYQTSSVGRLFDAVSAMLGICSSNRYEGEAAMALEWSADESDCYEPYPVDVIGEPKQFMIDIRKAIAQIAEDILGGNSVRTISTRFHDTMAETVRAGAIETRKRTGISQVVLSGGVFQNIRLLNRSLIMLDQEGFKTAISGIIPSNDGGLSLGQAAVAAARLLESRFAKGVA